jgi:hypothetical protein
MRSALKKIVALGGLTVLAASLVFVAHSAVKTAHDKNTVKVPGGIGFAEFKGYESWQVIAVSKNDKLMAVILGNPVMIRAYQAGIPGNGKPFPDGSRMTKIHWVPKMSATAPSPTSVPGTLHDVDFMVKDSKRFADSGGWGWGAFQYDAATDTFTPSTEASQPPQDHDAKCGFACHTIVKNRDYVFTEYGRR